MVISNNQINKWFEVEMKKEQIKMDWEIQTLEKVRSNLRFAERWLNVNIDKAKEELSEGKSEFAKLSPITQQSYPELRKKIKRLEGVIK